MNDNRQFTLAEDGEPHILVRDSAWLQQLHNPQGLEQKLLSSGVQVLALETGMDRAQLRFRWHNSDFLLMAESVCEALWIVPHSHGDQPKLPLLAQHLANKS